MEKYNAFKEIAKRFGYNESNLTFQDDFAVQNLHDLATSLQEFVKIRFEPGDNVRHEFKSDKEDLGWNGGDLHSIALMGVVKKVDSNRSLAFVKWNIVENLTNQTTIGRKQLPDNLLHSKWFCDDTILENGYFFWDLKPSEIIPASSIEPSTVPTIEESLCWKDEIANMQREGVITYKDFITDRLPASDSLSEWSVIDSLNHRTEIFVKPPGDDKKNYSTKVFEDSDDDDDEENSPTMTESELEESSEPFIVLTNTIMKCNLAAKQEIFQKLFEQRYSAPIIFEKSNNCLINYINSFRFVDIRLEDRNLNLFDDISLKRVCFLSECNETSSQSLQMVKEVFNCNMASLGYKGALGLMAELAVGFFNCNRHNSAKSYEPWLVLHVRGNFAPLKYFIERFSDLLIIEVENESDVKFNSKETPQTLKIFKWNVSGQSKIIEKQKAIFGSFHYISGTLSDAIGQVSKKIEQNKRVKIHQIQDENLYYVDEIAGLEEFASSVMEIDITNARESFLLQSSYASECSINFQIQSRRRDGISRAIEASLFFKCEQEQDYRRQEAAKQLKLPILEKFVNIHKIRDDHLRVVILRLFESILSGKIDQALEVEKRKVSKALNYYLSLPDGSDDAAIAQKQYYSAKKIYRNKYLGLQHLWRELSHIFAAGVHKYRHLSAMVAQNLIDGFVFEFLDGDAGMVNMEWFQSVFKCLNLQLKEDLGRDPRVVVLSIVGTQSTGKSTILNAMFGCHLHTSVGQCTRGINLQLIKADNRNEKFDYIIVLDTEGLRAPENFDSDDKYWKDNRLATFSILTADATMFTSVSEDDTAIKEVLPMVVLAFKGSSIAEEESGRVQSMLFFIYTKVYTSQFASDKLAENRWKLCTDLQNEIKKIEDCKAVDHTNVDSKEKEARLERGGKYISLTRFLQNLRMSENERNSDIQYIGWLSEDNKPPNDSPNFSFGQRVTEIKKHIFQRLEEVNFEAQTLTEWIDYVKRVSVCVSTSDFELNFQSTMQYQAFTNLRNEIEKSKNTISEAYENAFKICEDCQLCFCG
eukprot:gene15446-17025_t